MAAVGMGPPLAVIGAGSPAYSIAEVGAYAGELRAANQTAGRIKRK